MTQGLKSPIQNTRRLARRNRHKCSRFAASAILASALAVFGSRSTAAEMIVAQILPRTGPVSKDAEAISLGVRVGVEATNSSGGIRGTSVRLLTADDRYQAEETEQQMRRAVLGEAVAAITPVGSASMQRILQRGVLEEIQLPVVGVVPGSEVLRDPGSPWLFHVRASDDRQIEKIVEHLWTIGHRRVAVLYGNIPFGQAALAAFRKQLAARSEQPALALPFDMAKPEASLVGLAAKVTTARADSITIVAPATQSAMIIKLLRDEGVFLPIYSLSYSDVDTICAIAGAKNARGVGVAQVVPSHRSRSVPIAAEFERDWARFAPKNAIPSQYAFEAYIAWRVLAEALLRSQEPLTRAGVRKSLERLSGASISGFRVSFSAVLREGSSFVDIAVIDGSCKLQY